MRRTGEFDIAIAAADDLRATFRWGSSASRVTTPGRRVADGNDSV